MLQLFEEAKQHTVELVKEGVMIFDTKKPMYMLGNRLVPPGCGVLPHAEALPVPGSYCSYLLCNGVKVNLCWEDVLNSSRE